MRFMSGFGIVAQLTTGTLALRNVSVVPREGRYCASAADMLHFSGCGGDRYYCYYSLSLLTH